jgi:hypothetical protein
MGNVKKGTQNPPIFTVMSVRFRPPAPNLSPTKFQPVKQRSIHPITTWLPNLLFSSAYANFTLLKIDWRRLDFTAGRFRIIPMLGSDHQS